MQYNKVTFINIQIFIHSNSHNLKGSHSYPLTSQTYCRSQLCAMNSSVYTAKGVGNKRGCQTPVEYLGLCGRWWLLVLPNCLTKPVLFERVNAHELQNFCPVSHSSVIVPTSSSFIRAYYNSYEFAILTKLKTTQ